MMRGASKERNATGSEVYVQAAVVVKKERNGLAKLPHMHDAVQGYNHMLWNDDILCGYIPVLVLSLLRVLLPVLA